VIAEYTFGDTKLCKECGKDGEWSKFSDASICKELTTPRPKADCRYDNLKEIEYNQLDYVRVRIESPDGLYKIEEPYILDNKLAPKTVVVYQKCVIIYYIFMVKFKMLYMIVKFLIKFFKIKSGLYFE
jgi:hypothetical protein